MEELLRQATLMEEKHANFTRIQYKILELLSAAQMEENMQIFKIIQWKMLGGVVETSCPNGRR